MSHRLLCAAVILVALAVPAEAAGCHVDSFRTVFGADTDSHMAVTSGRTCTIHMRSGERMRSANIGSATGTTLDEQAQHGTVTIPGPHEIVYAPKRGYVGPDRFVFERSGESMSRDGKTIHRGTSHYTIAVDVSP